jgi:rubrerythrin
MAILVCKRCGHLWMYKGDSAMATCPGCRTRLSKKRNKVNRPETLWEMLVHG